MADHNILNRASFDDMQKTFTVQVQPFIREGTATLDLGSPNNVFWIRRIAWEYKYADVGVPGARKIPIQPIEVSVADILQNVKRALPQFTEARPVVGRVPFKVINTNLANNHRLEVDFYLDGILVTPRNGTDPISLKQMKAYVMMDSSSRGQLALDEAATDQLEEVFSQLGMGSIRDAIPGGLGALKSLPLPLQSAFIQSLVSKGTLPQFMAQGHLLSGPQAPQPLALPAIDPQKEQSAFLGDMVASLPEEIQIPSKEQLLKLANTMIEKGWRKV